LTNHKVARHRTKTNKPTTTKTKKKTRYKKLKRWGTAKCWTQICTKN